MFQLSVKCCVAYIMGLYCQIIPMEDSPVHENMCGNRRERNISTAFMSIFNPHQVSLQESRCNLCSDKTGAFC